VRPGNEFGRSLFVCSSFCLYCSGSNFSKLSHRNHILVRTHIFRIFRLRSSIRVVIGSGSMPYQRNYIHAHTRVVYFWPKGNLGWNLGLIRMKTVQLLANHWLLRCPTFAQVYGSCAPWLSTVASPAPPTPLYEKFLDRLNWQPYSS